jgi:nickel-dependent lactate racemase
MAHPIGSRRLRELVVPGQRVAIVTSDLTRPCPSARLLPYILEELGSAGVEEDDILVVLALGLHRPMTGPEMEEAVGSEVSQRVRVINHDPASTVRLGTTSRGTPVEILTHVVDADVRVCLGNLELHYFAGYSGGAKAILPGCASRATVQANHAMMVKPEACAGRLDGNPLRADLEEGAAMVGIDFILNVIVDSDHRIVGGRKGWSTGRRHTRRSVLGVGTLKGQDESGKRQYYGMYVFHRRI